MRTEGERMREFVASETITIRIDSGTARLSEGADDLAVIASVNNTNQTPSATAQSVTGDETRH